MLSQGAGPHYTSARMTLRPAISVLRQARTPAKTNCFRVLGVDPALAGATGYGVIECEGNGARLLRFGALKLSARASFDARLREVISGE